MTNTHRQSFRLGIYCRPVGGGGGGGGHNSSKQRGGEGDDAQTRGSVIRLKDDTGQAT